MKCLVLSLGAAAVTGAAASDWRILNADTDVLVLDRAPSGLSVFNSVLSLSYDAQSAVSASDAGDDQSAGDDADNAPELAYDREMYATLSKASPKLLEKWEQHDRIDQQTLAKIAGGAMNFLQQRQTVNQQQA